MKKIFALGAISFMFAACGDTYETYEVLQAAESIDTLYTSSIDTIFVSNANTSYVFKPDTGSFIDERDGKEYRWTKIGSQVWMRDNLAYDDGSDGISIITDTNDCSNYWYPELKDIYYYDFYSAQNICPSGWHLPSRDDWLTLKEFILTNADDTTNITNTIASERCWRRTIGSDNTFKFSARALGRYYSEKDTVYEYGTDAWFSSSYIDDHRTVHSAFHIVVGDVKRIIFSVDYSREIKYSVRCIKDN